MDFDTTTGMARTFCLRQALGVPSCLSAGLAVGSPGKTFAELSQYQATTWRVEDGLSWDEIAATEAKEAPSRGLGGQEKAEIKQP